MISEAPCSEAYVWVWLPEADAPVVAGLLSRRGQQLVFNYGRSYLARSDAISLYTPELTLRTDEIRPLPGLDMPSCIRDASPDAWGRRVLLNRKLGGKGVRARTEELDELSYLLESGSDRIGALDFQASSSDYVPRQAQNASLEELLTAAEGVERGLLLGPELSLALQHGTSIGGARPKALIEDGKKKYIAKFSASHDQYNVVKAEFIAMRLAAHVGLDVAKVQLSAALGKDVLLIERFDRVLHDGVWRRKAMVSALTMLELDEMMAAYASYEKLTEIIRHRFADPKTAARELFGRLVFNVLCGNTDDHARNHAAFWDGHRPSLTPAYDLCPQLRTGEEASQAMRIRGDDRRSQIAACLDAAPNFLLKPADAIELVNQQVRIIEREWDSVCAEAGLAPVDRAFLWRRQFLNRYAFYDAPKGVEVPG